MPYCQSQLFPTDKSKDTLNTMKNYGTKTDLLLSQWLITQPTMMKNIWKSNLIQINAMVS